MTLIKKLYSNMWAQFLFPLFVYIYCESDYYKILGVENDADDRTIRKAFKKLAIQKHPDKNKEDPEAHAEFVKINRAYEILKDEEMRKKYDQFGEKGLEEGFQAGNNYQSWQFYNDNFGIYDDDQEIVTLNRADFQRLVSDSGEMWFINFYSTYCSHCHQLAPTWRKFSREMKGTVRIGAVNCAEDPVLCQSQQVGAYPSLVMYPTGEFYNGVREVELLVEFVVQRMKSEVLHLKLDNMDILSKEWEPYNGRPWIVDFCDETDSCLSTINRRKLAAMLDGLVNVGTVNCKMEGELCKTLKRTQEVVFYPTKQISHQTEKVLNSLDPGELSEEAISYLDGLEEIEEQEFVQLLGENGAQWSTAVWFISSSETLRDHLDYRRLPAMLPSTRILYADCSKFHNLCREHIDVKKLPQFVVFKPSGGYEIDYVNKISYRDAYLFIKESTVSPLHALNDKTYTDVINSGKLWIVDYFAPWCPPCLRLMTEYRRLHSNIYKFGIPAEINIGSIDCQKYNHICHKAGVKSYPTSVFYTGDRKIHKIVGFHTVQMLLEFIDNALHPSVDELSPSDFDEVVNMRSEDETWVVDYFAPWCVPCQQLTSELQQAARTIREFDKRVHFGSVDCEAHANFCREQNIVSYPTIRLFSAKVQKNKRVVYYDYPPHMWRNRENIERWVFGMLPSLVTTVTNDFWTTVLDADEPWVVDFFAPWCSHCVQFTPVFEQVAKILEGKVKLAKVDCDQWPGVCQEAQVRSYPTIRLYKGKRGRQRQDVWGLQLQSRDRDTIVEIVKGHLEITTAHDEL